MAFPDGFLDELIARNDITDVVGNYVSLTKRSGSNQFGLCPFHSEKTPSFSVSSDKQIYHCFGCGKGGSVINFIMEMEGLSFRDAVEFLAKRAGMEMPDDGTSEQQKNKRARLLSLNKDAARFFHDCLTGPEGKTAVAYIQKRGITKAYVTKFGLGAAPDSWNSLLNAMIARGYSYQELFEAGLCKRSAKKDSFYDTFRNRLMFPVIDVRGSVLGFSGRALGENEPKYLNSPDTPVFNKSRNLFGINLAKKTKAEQFILCEGNIDVVSLHQAGFDSAVASLGTALTPDQARLISRYSQNVVIAYDGDEAGIKAAQRAIGIFETVGLSVRVLRITGAKDPDEYIKAYGAEAFSHLLDGSPDRLDYQLSQIKSAFNLNEDRDKIDYLSKATDFLAGLSNSVEREIYAARISDETGVSKEAVLIETRKKAHSIAGKEKKKREADLLRPIQARQPADHAIRYQNIFSATAEEGVIRLLLLDPSLVDIASKLNENEFSSPFLKKTFHILIDKITSGSDISAASLCANLDPSEAQHITSILQKPENISDGKQSMADYVKKIQNCSIRSNMNNDLEQIANMYRDKKGYDNHE